MADNSLLNDVIQDGNMEMAKYLMELKAEFNKGLSQFRANVKAPNKNGHVDFKTAKGGRTKYDYVLLDDLIAAIDEAIKGTGITWTQDTVNTNGITRVRTILRCVNGWSEASSWTELPSKGSAQDVGSAITYAKRYSLSATFGVSSDVDDDGELATEAYDNGRQTQRQAPKNTHATPAPDNLANEKQKQELVDLIKKLAVVTDVEDPNIILKTIIKAKHAHNWANLTKTDFQVMKKEVETQLMEAEQQAAKEAMANA